MSEYKAVVWFADDPKPNVFFFRSPFRSWKFLVNTGVLTALFFGFGIVLFRNWSNWLFVSRFVWAVFFMLNSAVYPFLRVFQSHRKINELYLAGKIAKQSAESPIDTLLSVADHALNDGLFYSSTCLGMLLLFGWVIRLK